MMRLQSIEFQIEPSSVRGQEDGVHVRLDYKTKYLKI